MGAAVLLTLPAWLDRAAYAASDSTSLAVQVQSDHTDGAALDVLLHVIRAGGGGPHLRGTAGELGRSV